MSRVLSLMPVHSPLARLVSRIRVLHRRGYCWVGVRGGNRWDDKTPVIERRGFNYITDSANLASYLFDTSSSLLTIKSFTETIEHASPTLYITCDQISQNCPLE